MRVNMTGDDPFHLRLMEGEKPSAAADGGEGEAPAPAAEAEADDKADEKPGKKPWYERRIAELTQANKTKERQIADLRQLSQQPAKAAAAVDGEEGDRVYTEAEVAALLKDQTAVTAQATDFQNRCNDAVDKGKKDYTDFATVVANYRQFGGVDELEKNFGLISQVLDTDAPHKVLYELASDPEALTEVLEMRPNKRMIHLAKLASGKPKAQSKVPAPPNPVKGGDAPIVDPLDKRQDTDTWIKNRNEQVKKSGNKRLIGAANFR